MKKIIITCIIILCSISNTYATDDNLFDAFRGSYQGYLNTYLEPIDGQIETYLESIQFFEGKYVELIRDIGTRFSRGGLTDTSQGSWYDDYHKVCDTGYIYATEELSREQGIDTAILTSSQEHINLKNTCKVLMDNKLIAYKKAATILSFEQLGRLIEYDHKVYLQGIQTMQKNLMSKIHRTLTKMNEAGSTYKPVSQVLE